jgi:exopolysaccharide biosynthesis polyprenyl glycosylphosphotransferase
MAAARRPTSGRAATRRVGPTCVTSKTTHRGQTADAQRDGGGMSKVVPPVFRRYALALKRHGAAIAYGLAAGLVLVLVSSPTSAWLEGALAALGVVGLVLRHRSQLARERMPTLLVGSPAAVLALREELRFYGIDRYDVVGSVTPNGQRSVHELGLGTLADLREVVDEHDVKLVLMSSRASRLATFDAMARDCPDLDVQLCDLSEFYEDTFRYTPIAEINSAWFSSILHPRFREQSSWLKRTFDVTFAAIVGVLMLPVLAVLAWVIRRDGGPALFSQVRIGEGGRPFKVYKLRTMSVRPAEDVSWSSDDDPRVTSIGRRLRRLHLDELPQLWNIIRGEMSVVGPRPEQPEIVTRLEREFRFYRRRHMVRPGLAGWAQARCGYAGSDTGVAWKLSHDLYYLKRRSLRFDLYVLLASVWEAVAGNQFREPRHTPVVVRPSGDLVSWAAPLEETATLEFEVAQR